MKGSVFGILGKVEYRFKYEMSKDYVLKLYSGHVAPPDYLGIRYRLDRHNSGSSAMRINLASILGRPDVRTAKEKVARALEYNLKKIYCGMYVTRIIFKKEGG